MSFADLNVSFPVKQATLDQLKKLGYASVAINHIYADKPANIQMPAMPVSIDARFKIYSRLTLVLEDTSANYNLAKTAKGYDLLAVRPTSEKTLQYACTQMEVDIISLDLTQRLPYYLKHATLGSALSRGVFLEISYAPGLSDSSARRQLLSNAASLVRASRGRGLLISSGATGPLGLRSPYDCINLATFWGLSQEGGRKAVAEHASAVLIKAETRRTVYKGVLRMVQVPEILKPPAPAIASGEATAGKRAKKQQHQQKQKEKQGAKRPVEANAGDGLVKKQKTG